MMEYLVVVMLTFMDGSVVQYNNGQWEVASSYEDCQKSIVKATTELKEEYKDSDPKPSTFLTMCLSKDGVQKNE